MTNPIPHKGVGDFYMCAQHGRTITGASLVKHSDVVTDLPQVDHLCTLASALSYCMLSSLFVL